MPTDKEVEIEAERIADTTDLSWREAAVLVSDRNDLSDRRIQRIIGRSQTTISRVRRRIRRKKRSVDQLERTIETLTD